MTGRGIQISDDDGIWIGFWDHGSFLDNGKYIHIDLDGNLWLDEKYLTDDRKRLNKRRRRGVIIRKDGSIDNYES